MAAISEKMAGKNFFAVEYLYAKSKQFILE